MLKIFQVLKFELLKTKTYPIPWLLGGRFVRKSFFPLADFYLMKKSAKVVRNPSLQPMDEGTLKTAIPSCRLHWLFCLGVMKQFGRFWIWSETECKIPAKFGLQHNPLPLPPEHTLSVYTVHLVWEGGRDVREKIEGQQYTSIVSSSMGAIVRKLGRKYHWVNVSPVYKIC